LPSTGQVGQRREVAITMEQEQQAGVQAPNEIDQEQQAMDLEQAGESSAPQYLTYGAARELLAEQHRVYERQIAGLQSKVDTGLNAIRRDTSQQAQAMAAAQRNAQFEQSLEDIPEEQRPPLRLLFQQQQALQVPIAPEPQEQAVQPAQIDQVAMQLAQKFGVDPTAYNIQGAINILGNQAMDEVDRMSQFYLALNEIKMGTSGQQTVTRSVAPRQQQQQTAPPGQASPGTGGTMNTAEDVRDAFISGRLPIDQYRERMTALGEPV
jgi:hypothetical protein